jgi:hypothetical protein
MELAMKVINVLIIKRITIETIKELLSLLIFLFMVILKKNKRPLKLKL